MNSKGKAYLAVMLAVWLLVLSTRESRAQLLAVTPHELLPEQKIMVEGEEAPPWKSLWNEARKSALQGDFDKALRQYKAVLVLKNNLEEARWELARILIYIKHWQEAAEVLELLIESSPENMNYIDAFGKVMWEMEQYERSVSLFKKAYEKNSSDRTALAGLVEGLIKLDRKNEALPFLEQLSRQEPTNRGVRRYLAYLLYESGDYEKARGHLTILARSEDVGLDVLTKTARTFEHLGLGQQAALYWERVLAREPENRNAHEFLARYYEENGQPDRALDHLEVILALNPDDADTYLRLARNYENIGEFDKAQTYYEKVLEKKPKDQKIIRLLASFKEDRIHKRQASPVSRPQTVVDQEQITTLQKTISDLEAAGRYSEAIQVYRRLLRISPENREILVKLMNDLAALGKSEDYGLAEFLSGMTSDDISIIRSMAEVLHQMSRENEFIAALSRIHELDPGDDPTTRELALLNLNRGDLSQSRKYFGELSDSGCLNARCLEARAVLHERTNLPSHRLKDYEALLKLEPDRYEIRLKAIGLAAQLGLLDTALFHAGYLQNLASAKNNLELKTAIADAYRTSGYLSRAVERYQNILDQTENIKEADLGHFRVRSWLGMVEAYKRLGLNYEAEQALRLALVKEEQQIPLLAAMFHLYLETGRVEQSRIWLETMNRALDDLEQDTYAPTNPVWIKEFFQAEMYEAAGDYGLAVDLYKQAASLKPENEHNTDRLYDPVDLTSGVRIRLHLAAALLKAERFEEAEKIVLAGRSDREIDLDQLVLLGQIYLSEGLNVKAEKVFLEAERYAAEGFGRQLQLAALYERYGYFARQVEAARKAATDESQSLAVQSQLISAHINLEQYEITLDLLDQLLKDYPENTLFLSLQAEILAKVGNFREALIATNMILTDFHDRRDMVLLQSRILWEMNRWKDSVSLYESILEPRVSDIMVQKINELALTLDQKREKNSWWEAVAFSGKSSDDIARLLMSPEKAADLSDKSKKLNSAAAPFYALYRWQDQFEKELSVRRSVMRREYYHAANKMEKLMAEFGSNDFLLYDLAGLYSKLDRLGDEATVYRKLKGQNEDFPGLADAVQRNNLKRRPQVFLSYSRQEDDGWEGYKAVEQEMAATGFKFYHSNNRHWDIEASRIYYESTRGDQSLDSWRTMLSYDVKLSQNLGVTFGGGVEKLGSGYAGTPLWFGALKGKIADEMLAVFSVKQDVVTDTIASLKRNIKKRDYKIEFFFDLFPRLLLGGHFDFTDYSDRNWTNNYRFWASYIVFPEPVSLKVNYKYDLYDSFEGKIPGAPTDDGFAFSDHPYWSPVNYWITRFSVNFRHQLSDDALARGIPSYYTIEYSLGYDTENNDLHELKCSLNFEIAKNYTISGSYGYLDLDVFQHKELFLALMYRF